MTDRAVPGSFDAPTIHAERVCHRPSGGRERKFSVHILYYGAALLELLVTRR